MMHHFLNHNRLELIERCRDKVALRPLRGATREQLEHGVPLFLAQLIETLQIEQTAEPMRSRAISGQAGGDKQFLSVIGATAAQHGRELLGLGFTVDQVVHGYGDLCQSIGDLAAKRNEAFDVDEYRTLNRCLDNAIADAVTAFSGQRDVVAADQQALAVNERLGFFAHELRNYLNTATLALTAIKTGKVGVSGTTGAVLDRSLVGLRNLIDRSLTEVRMSAGMSLQNRLYSLADLIAELRCAATLEAQVRGCIFTVPAVDPLLAVDADRDLLFSAVGNLLQYAFKFTLPGTEVTLHAYAEAERIFINVKDHCGGLAPHVAENMFTPFAQGEADKTGLGLGLSIARRSVEANGGRLSVRNLPGCGCVFTLELPRHALEPPSTTESVD
nr:MULTISPECIES: HAMP domain-containing sensor histidine kinase [unclassified Janthinobacterium]